MVEVKIGGQIHTDWQSYEIDSDLMTPADAWRVTLAQAQIVLPPEVVEGAAVEVRLNRDMVLSGRLDERNLRVGKGQHDLTLGGRDGAGILLDCSAPVLAGRGLTLEDVVAKLVRPLGVTRIRIEADTKLLREKINTEPGDTAWDSLRRAAEANGLWPWFEPDGTLVVGGPRYDLPAVATLVLRADGKGNNGLTIAERRSIVERYSEVTVYGQAHAGGSGAGERDGRHNIKAVVRDDGLTVYRPKVVVDHEAINEDIARARGRKIISDARLKGYSLIASINGHRTESGVLWTPGQRVNVKSEPHGIDGTFFLMARRLAGDKATGQRSTLTLKEDGVWTLDAHPSKRKHRRGKNSLPGRVLDLTTGAPK
uniref:phage baseplate assembly protein n=1 Tax=Polaromonas sp. 39-63-25 TaxID=1970420 RepID=UPI0025ED25B6|nr:phage tail protein [Polaromonas sp. 39-63-25]